MMARRVRLDSRESRCRLGRWDIVGALLLAGSMFLSGCSSLDLRGGPFARDETFNWMGRVRPADENINPFGFSNKAREIEQNLGAR